jgi:hypothetical protein
MDKGMAGYDKAYLCTGQIPVHPGQASQRSPLSVRQPFGSGCPDEPISYLQLTYLGWLE